MKALFLDLKSRYEKADINMINSETIAIHFNNAQEPVIIQKEVKSDLFIVSYPKVTLTHNGKKEEHITSRNILLEGLLWILKKVNNGKVLPAI